jgi:opacity protein-like surface antigen
MLAVALLAAPPTLATDVSIMGGLQLNGDFQVSADFNPSATSTIAPSDDISVATDGVGALAIDVEINGNPTERIGAFLSHHRTNLDANLGLQATGLKLTNLHLTASKVYPDGDLEGFVTAGAGATFLDPEDGQLNSSTQFSLQVGAGAQYAVTEQLFIRAEARWLPIITGSNAAGLCSGGCIIALDAEYYSQTQFNVGFVLRF